MADEPMDQQDSTWGFGDVSADSTSSYYESNYEDVATPDRGANSGSTQNRNEMPRNAWFQEAKYAHGGSSSVRFRLG